MSTCQCENGGCGNTSVSQEISELGTSVRTAIVDWAKVETLKAGDWVITDDCFSCRPNRAISTVQGDPEEGLYITCAVSAELPDPPPKNMIMSDKHYLHGQRLSNGQYIGVVKLEEAPNANWHYILHREPNGPLQLISITNAVLEAFMKATIS